MVVFVSGFVLPLEFGFICVLAYLWLSGICIAGILGRRDSNAELVRDLPSEGVERFEEDLSIRLGWN